MGREARVLKHERPEPTKVSEVLALKIENVTLKLQQLQTLAQTLQADQQKWIAEARAEVGADPDALYHVEKRIFE